MQRLLQTHCEKGLIVRVPRREELRHRQEAEKPMSVLSLPEMSQLWNEARGSAGGATARLQSSKSKKTPLTPLTTVC